MLQTMRQGAGSCLAKGLFVLLLISFVGWGIAGWINGDTAMMPQTALRVNGESVGVRELQNDFSRDLQYMRQMNPTLRAEDVRSLLTGASVDRVIDSKLLRQFAEAQGMKLDQNAVVALVQQDPIFRSELTDKFDPERAAAIAQSVGGNDAFVALYSEDKLRRLVTESMSQDLSAPQPLVDMLVAHDAQRRTASVLRLANSALVQVPEPTDAELQAQYDGNKAKYTKPEFRTVDLALVTESTLAGKQTASDEELQAAYDAAGARFNQPEKRDVDAARFETEDEAKAFAAAAAGEGADFKAVAEAMHGSFVSFPGTEKSQLIVSDLRDPAFAAQLNALVGPVQSSLGWYVGRVTKIEPAQVQPLDAVRETLRGEVQRRKAVEAVGALRDDGKLDDAIAGGKKLAEIADSLGVPVQSGVVMDMFGRNPDVKPALQGPELPQVARTAFATSPGADPQLVALDSGGYALLTVSDVKSEQLQPLEQVRDLVVTDWRAAKLKELADAERVKLVDSLTKKEATLEDLGTRFSAGIEQTPPFTRSGDGWAGAPAGLAAHAFELKQGEVFGMASGDAQWLLRLDSIDKSAAPADPMAASERGDRIKEAMTREVQDGMTKALRAAGTIVRDDAVIQRTAEQMQ